MDTHTIVEGDERTKAWLETSPAIVDDWLYELTDETAFFAAERLKTHAPGRINELVDVDLANEVHVGAFEATAGVEPEITEETFNRGLGSDPADFPVFVDVGTGIYGERHTMIESIPGHWMGPISDQDGGIFFARRVKGQRPQHFSTHAFEDTVGWLPMRIETAVHELGRRSA